MPDMKKLALFVILVGALAAAQTPGTTPDKPAVPALTAEQIFEKYVDAIGGRERIARIKTIVEKSATQTGKNRVTSVTYRKAPDRYAEVSEDSKGARTGIGFDGQTHWMLPPTELNGTAVWFTDRPAPDRSIAAQFRVHPYRNAKLRGVKKVNQRQAYVLELEFGQEDGDRWTYYLDVDTFLLARLDYEERSQFVFAGSKSGPGVPLAPLAARRYKSTYYYSDWRDVGGVKIPFEIKGKETTKKILDCQIDVAIDDSVFLPPSGSVIVQPHKKAESN